MRVSGKVISRCQLCRKKGRSGFGKCNHKGRRYLVAYRVDGMQKRETLGCNKKDAERRLAEIISQVHNGTYYKPAEIIFKEFVEKWIATKEPPKIKERTFYTYKATIRLHLNPYLGRIALTRITKETIEEMIVALQRKIKPKTINNTIKLLKSILRTAREWKYIQENPAEFIKNMKVDKPEMAFYNPEEIQLLIRHSRGKYKAINLVAVLTGMRKSEILALQWGDIDWKAKTIYVRRSIFWKPKKAVMEGENRWQFSTPKTKKSYRTIVMSPELEKALEIHRISAKVNPQDLVFCNKEGNPIDPDNLNKRGFFPAIAFAGLRKIRFHDLRHTYTSILLDTGENIKFIQKQLGHASIQTTIDRYAHLMPIDNVGVGRRIDEKIFGNSDAEEIFLSEQEAILERSK